jgi:hypothetical protein
MAAGRFIIPIAEPLMKDGNAVSGGLLRIYANGTTTLETIFQDKNLSVSALNPQTSDAQGRFYAQSTALWADAAKLYTISILFPTGETLVFNNIRPEPVDTESGLSTASWQPASSYGLSDAGTGAANKTAIDASITYFGTVAAPRVLMPATIDMRGRNVTVNTGARITQDWTEVNLDGSRIAAGDNTAPMLNFDSLNAAALNYVGVRGTFVLDGQANTQHIIRANAARQWRQTGGNMNIFDWNGDAVRLAGCVGPFISNMFCRAKNVAGTTATAADARGLVLTTGLSTAAVPIDTQRAVVLNLTAYDMGGEGLVMEGGGGHLIMGLDIETAGTKVGAGRAAARISRSFGNTILGAYTEVNGDSNTGYDLIIDDVMPSPTTVATTAFNSVIGGYWTKIWLKGGQTALFAAGNCLTEFKIDAGVQQTIIGPDFRIANTLTDNGTDTAKWFWSPGSPEVYLKRSTAKRFTLNVDSLVQIGSDSGIKINSLRGFSRTTTQRNVHSGSISITGDGATTEWAVTFGVAEPDTSYDVFFSTGEQTAGANLAPSAMVATVKQATRTINGFTARLAAAPAVGQNLFIPWSIVGR